MEQTDQALGIVMGDRVGSVRPLSTLGFERSVHEIVAPALAEFGFAVVQSGARDVRFESDRVWAWVFHEEGPSHAIGFRFDRLGDPNEDDAYLVPHAMQLVDPAGAVREEDPSARTADEVRGGLERLKRNIQTYCSSALRGDADVFAAMKRANDKYLRQFSEWTYRAVDMGFSDALRRGDWARVVEVYASAEHDLNSLAARNFLIAQQNVRTLRYWDPECDEQPLRAELARAYASYGHFDSYGNFDGTAEERECVERAVGAAMDARDWERVIELYGSASYDLEFVERARLAIARRQLGESGADPTSSG